MTANGFFIWNITVTVPGHAVMRFVRQKEETKKRKYTQVYNAFAKFEKDMDLAKLKMDFAVKDVIDHECPELWKQLSKGSNTEGYGLFHFYNADHHTVSLASKETRVAFLIPFLSCCLGRSQLLLINAHW